MFIDHKSDPWISQKKTDIWWNLHCVWKVTMTDGNWDLQPWHTSFFLLCSIPDIPELFTHFSSKWLFPICTHYINAHIFNDWCTMTTRNLGIHLCEAHIRVGLVHWRSHRRFVGGAEESRARLQSFQLHVLKGARFTSLVMHRHFQRPWKHKVVSVRNT